LAVTAAARSGTLSMALRWAASLRGLLEGQRRDEDIAPYPGTASLAGPVEEQRGFPRCCMKRISARHEKSEKTQIVLVKNFTIRQLFARFRRDVGFSGVAGNAAIRFAEA